MNEFNEFIVKISEIRKYMFLTLVFLFLLLFPFLVQSSPSLLKSYKSIFDTSL